MKLAKIDQVIMLNRIFSKELQCAINADSVGFYDYSNNLISTIDEITNNNPFGLPSLFDHFGFQVSELDCLNLLCLYNRYKLGSVRRSMDLYNALKSNECSTEIMWLWLVCLDVADPNGFIDAEWFYRKGFIKSKDLYNDRKLPEEILLTEEGIDFINNARYILLNYGYKLVKKNYPNLNFASYAGY